MIIFLPDKCQNLGQFMITHCICMLADPQKNEGDREADTLVLNFSPKIKVQGFPWTHSPLISFFRRESTDNSYMAGSGADIELSSKTSWECRVYVCHFRRRCHWVFRNQSRIQFRSTRDRKIDRSIHQSPRQRYCQYHQSLPRSYHP